MTGSKVFEIGRKEGYPGMEIGDMVREKMKDEYSSMTIQRVLPETAKDIRHSNENAGRKPNFDFILKSNEHKDTNVKLTRYHSRDTEEGLGIIQNCRQNVCKYLKKIRI